MAQVKQLVGASAGYTCEKASGMYTMDCQTQIPRPFLPLLSSNSGQAGN